MMRLYLSCYLSGTGSVICSVCVSADGVILRSVCVVMLELNCLHTCMLSRNALVVSLFENMSFVGMPLD